MKTLRLSFLAIAASLLLALTFFLFGGTPEAAPARPASADQAGTAELFVPLSADAQVPARPVAAAEAAPARVEQRASGPQDRFADVPDLMVREQHIAPATLERQRLVRLPNQSSKVLVQERWMVDAQGEPEGLAEQQAMLADQVLVEVSEEALPELRAAAERFGYTPVSGGWQPGLLVLDLGAESLESVPVALTRLAAAVGEGGVVEPDFLHFPALTANDPHLWRQWGLERIEAAAAWDLTTGNSEVVVAVIDSGVALSHPDLVGNLDLAHAWDFVRENNQPEDDNGHGTHIAGIIGGVGHNGVGVTGLNWKTSVLPLRVGDATFATSKIIEALTYVVNLKLHQGVNIVATNNSYGTTASSSTLRSAIEKTRDAGILFIAAAGNESTDMDSEAPSYPAAYPVENIISVASTTSDEQMSSFSNYSSQFVHLGAPGSNIYSTIRGDSYGAMNGTSMAAPFVAGAVALVASASPELSWQEVKGEILATVDPLPALQGKTVTGGRLNVRRLLQNGAIRDLEVRRLSPAAPAVRLPNTDLSLHLDAEIEGHGGVEIEWEAVKGGTSVTFAAREEGGVFASFAREGDYLLRAFVDFEGARIASDVLLVTVGDADPLTDGLLGYWKFDDAGGRTAANTVDGGPAGALVENTSWTEGRREGSIDFDGLNARVDFSAAPSEQVTISAWVRSNSSGQSVFPRVVEGPEHFLFFGRDPASPDSGNRNTIKFFAGKTSSDGIWNVPPDSVGDGEWYHVTATYDGAAVSNRPSIYLNGRSLPVSAQIAPAGDRAASGMNWSIGDSRSNTRTWHGQIDDVRVYRRVLSPEEVSALAGEAFSQEAPGLVLHAPGSATVGEAVELQAEFEGGVAAAEGASIRWSLTSGPAAVSFAVSSSGSTTATFPTEGIYDLRVEVASEGLRLAEDFRVEAGAEQPHLEIFSDRSRTLRSPAFPVEVRVTTTQPAATETTVNLEVDGDAQSGTDFEPLPSSVIIPAGETEARLFLVPMEAAASAGEPEVIIRLAASNTHTVSANSAVSLRLHSISYSGWRSYFYGESLSEPEDAPLKYALGLPFDEARSSIHPHLPQGNISTSSEDPFLTLTYRRPAGLPDARYEVEIFDGSGDWKLIELPEDVRSLGNGLEEVTVRDAVPVSEARTRLMRLRVRVEDPVSTQ